MIHFDFIFVRCEIIVKVGLVLCVCGGGVWHMTKILNSIFPAYPFLHLSFYICSATWNVLHLEGSSSSFKFQLNSTSSKKVFIISLLSYNPLLFPLQSLPPFIIICNYLETLLVLCFLYISPWFTRCLAHRKHLSSIWRLNECNFTTTVSNFGSRLCSVLVLFSLLARLPFS